MAYNQHIKNILLSDNTELLTRNKNKVSTAIVEILEDEILNFNLDEENEYDYLYKAFDILVNNLRDTKEMQIQLYDRFTFIHNEMRNILHTLPKEGLTDTQRNKIGSLHRIMNKMEDTMLRIYYNSPIEYDPSKEEYIYYIIFDLKNINFFRQACEKFPHMVNSLNKKGIPLIEVVLNKYLEALNDYISKPNLGPLDDLIYYDKVFTTILETDKFKISDVEKKLLLNKINKFKTAHQRVPSQRAKEKLCFFTNSALIKLNGEKEEETNSYLNYKYEVHDVFKEAHKSEAKQIYIANQKIKKPKYKKPIFTFDGEGACEIDDGLSITFEDGIYHLGVHIADPTAYINESSIINDEARKRTRSLYMEDGCIPMYPLILSKDIMGLNENQRTYSMSYYFDIDSRTGNLINFEIKAEPITVAKNMTYDQFDYILKHGTHNKNIEETIILLNQVSAILKQVYNEDLIYHEFHNLRDTSASRGIVESAMIYTNYNVARLFDERELPYIYRCHVVDEEEIKELTDLQERLRLRQRTDLMVKDLEMIKNLFPRAYYTRINDGHYGLGIDYYSHVTSPLRRYADNVANRCIKKFILNDYTEEDVKAYNDYIDMVAEEINQKRRSLDDYEIEIGKRKSLNK